MATAETSTSTTGGTAHSVSWSDEELSSLEQAVAQAPSVHDSRPWTLTLHNRTAVIRERTEGAPQRHDPHGRDRRISVGAAVENLLLAVRGAGWDADVKLGTTGGLVTATVTASHRAPPHGRELARVRAIPERRSHRERFAAQPVSEQVRADIAAAATGFRVFARWIEGEDEALWLARQLVYAARVYHGSRGYTTELSGWSTPAGRGLHEVSRDLNGLAAVGLATSGTRIPDEHALADWIQGESVLLLGTRSDRPSDHALSGEAMQRAWLTATASGLVASVMTQPLHLEEVRAQLARRLSPPASGHVLMRFGYAR